MTWPFSGHREDRMGCELTTDWVNFLLPCRVSRSVLQSCLIGLFVFGFQHQVGPCSVFWRPRKCARSAGHLYIRRLAGSCLDALSRAQGMEVLGFGCFGERHPNIGSATSNSSAKNVQLHYIIRLHPISSNNRRPSSPRCLGFNVIPYRLRVSWPS